jgi:hypothetical protein
MWMRRMIDMGVLPGGMTADATITHNVMIRQRPELEHAPFAGISVRHLGPN